MTSVARRYGLVHHGGEVGLSSPAPASLTLADAELGGSQHPANTSPGDQATAKARQRSRAARVVAPGANTRRETAGSRPPQAPAATANWAMGGAPQSPAVAGKQHGATAGGAPPVVLSPAMEAWRGELHEQFDGEEAGWLHAHAWLDLGVTDTGLQIGDRHWAVVGTGALLVLEEVHQAMSSRSTLVEQDEPMRAVVGATATALRLRRAIAKHVARVRQLDVLGVAFIRAWGVMVREGLLARAYQALDRPSELWAGGIAKPSGTSLLALATDASAPPRVWACVAEARPDPLDVRLLPIGSRLSRLSSQPTRAIPSATPADAAPRADPPEPGAPSCLVVRARDPAERV